MLYFSYCWQISLTILPGEVWARFGHPSRDEMTRKITQLHPHPFPALEQWRIMFYSFCRDFSNLLLQTKLPPPTLIIVFLAEWLRCGFIDLPSLWTKGRRQCDVPMLVNTSPEMFSSDSNTPQVLIDVIAYLRRGL